MKINSNSLIRRLGILVVFALMAITSGCNSSGPSGGLPETNDYRVEGVLVNDINANLVVGDTARIAVRAERNDSLLATAVVTFNGDTLIFDRSTFPVDSAHSFSDGPTSLAETGAYGVGLIDSSRFGDTLAFVVPDTFRIVSYTGDSTIPNTNGQEIQISWTGSANVEGYVIAVVLEDSTYRSYGYSTYVTSQATEATIPPDAYRLTTDPDGTPQLDAGWYNIYIYGYSGLPDSSMTDLLLPVPLPSDLPGDNIDLEDLSGRLGSVVVTKRVRSQVVSQ